MQTVNIRHSIQRKLQKRKYNAKSYTHWKKQHSINYFLYIYVCPFCLRYCVQDLTRGHRELAQWSALVILQNNYFDIFCMIASIV